MDAIHAGPLANNLAGDSLVGLVAGVVSFGLVIVGLLGLLYALGMYLRVLRDLPETPVRRRWRVAIVTVPIFIAGYLAFAVNLAIKPGTTVADLVVALVFGFGALFVALTGRLSLDAVRDIRRVVRLEHESQTDALTGLPNRRKFDLCFQRELQRARRYRTPLSLLIIDVDHFKSINDSYGHAVGDAILKTLAFRLGASIRSSDDIARFGGEELVIVAPETTLSNAAALGEKLRRVVADTPFTVPDDVQPLRPIPDGGLTITISVGVASHCENHPAFEDFVHEADGALYRAKALGRNRVALAGGEPDLAETRRVASSSDT